MATAQDMFGPGTGVSVLGSTSCNSSPRKEATARRGTSPASGSAGFHPTKGTTATGPPNRAGTSGLPLEQDAIEVASAMAAASRLTGPSRSA